MSGAALSASGAGVANAIARTSGVPSSSGRVCSYGPFVRATRPSLITLQPRRGRRSVVTAAFMGDPSSLEATVNAVSGVITTCALVGAAAFVLTSLPGEQEQGSLEEREACPQCNGSGYEPCVCTRWSSDGQGCASCSKGYMRCRACGGGGKARLALRPIKMEATDSSSRF